LSEKIGITSVTADKKITVVHPSTASLDIFLVDSLMVMPHLCPITTGEMAWLLGNNLASGHI